MRLDGGKDDLDKMKENWEQRMHWIWHRNMQAQNQAALDTGSALDIFEESLP